MLIGVPKEIKNHEYRAGMTPSSVYELTQRNHTVFIETNLGEGIGHSDEEYIAAGATVLATAEEVFNKAQMIVKVKEPLAIERKRLTKDHILFTYLHLAPDAEQTKDLVESNAVCIAYETITSSNGQLPLLTPMSEVAGRMSIQAGAACLQKSNGGSGVLLGGVPGVEPGKVVIIGATAPGLAIPKVTPVDRSADDNMIIANAIDDAINNTYLRPISLWMQALMGCLFLLLLALLYLRGISGTIIDVVFWIAQSAAVAITVISVSYTPYLFDLTLLVYAGMAFYIIEKVHTFSVERSRIGIHPFKPNFDFNEVITVRCEIDEQRPQEHVYCKFEETFGHKNVFFINELFSDESILADSLPSASYIIVNAEQAAVEATIAALPSQLGESLAILRAVANIDSNDSAEYFQEITRRCLENALHTINA